MGTYTPRKGDFLALSFDPHSGHEQSGRRPALVVSNDLFNGHTGMVVVCPVTRTDRRFPFHVAVPPGCPVTGFVMVEQVKSVDFRARRAARIARAPAALLEEVLAVLDACIY
ncbi:MAG: type II toxin-antitoxin system PemK/MazF family toxin [Deltaproteobacteria bacterium]|nr:type II toxin-antitoxin system PemK/MazF family toxin [Deltaproteobacteria bacterium]